MCVLNLCSWKRGCFQTKICFLLKLSCSHPINGYYLCYKCISFIFILFQKASVKSSVCGVCKFTPNPAKVLNDLKNYPSYGYIQLTCRFIFLYLLIIMNHCLTILMLSLFSKVIILMNIFYCLSQILITVKAINWFVDFSTTENKSFCIATAFYK